MHDLPGFVGDGIEVRYPPGYKGERGPTTMWMRTVPLLADEESSPFQRICPLADCGNAISANAPATDFGAINPDLTLVLHRDPVGEWFGSQSQSHWQLNGVGMSDSLLFDEQGAVGRALQTLAMGT